MAAHSSRRLPSLSLLLSLLLLIPVLWVMKSKSKIKSKSESKIEIPSARIQWQAPPGRARKIPCSIC